MNTSSFAAADSNQSDTQVTPMYVPCPNCGFGHLLTHIETFESYLIGSHVCPYRMDCLVKEYQTDRVEVTHCSDCEYGFTRQLSPIYSEEHSEPHY